MSTVTLYPGDCRAVLPTLPGDSVQLVVTSPPYNVGWKYADGGEADRLPLAEYQTLLADVLAQLYRVLQPGGVLALNLPPTIRTADARAWPLGAWAQMHLEKGPWLLREPVAWVKGKAGEARAKSTAWGAPTKSYLRPCHELLIVASKGDYRIPGQTWDRSIVTMDVLKDVWHVPAAPTRRGLPAPFPDDLVKRLVCLYSRAGDIVLDAFAGLGTVGRVAASLGRDAWLIEREPAYWPRLAALAGDDTGRRLAPRPTSEAMSMISEEQRAAWQLTPAEQALRADYAAHVAAWPDDGVAAELGNKNVERLSHFADEREMTIYISVLAAEHFRRVAAGAA